MRDVARILKRFASGVVEVNQIRWIVLVGTAAATLVGLGGCGPRGDRGPPGPPGPPSSYRFEHGDRIDAQGRREEHWCDAHREDEHCR